MEKNKDTSETYAAIKQRVRDIVTGYMTFRIDDDAIFQEALKDYRYRQFEVMNFADAIEDAFGLQMNNDEGLMPRHLAYFYLQYLLGITNKEKAHIALLSSTECSELISKMRQSYMLCNFYRFLAMIRYSIPVPKKKKVRRPKPNPTKPKIRVCKKCHIYKEIKLFPSGKICIQCLQKREPKMVSKTPRWIGTPDFMQRVEAGTYNQYQSSGP